MRVLEREGGREREEGRRERGREGKGGGRRKKKQLRITGRMYMIYTQVILGRKVEILAG